MRDMGLTLESLAVAAGVHKWGSALVKLKSHEVCGISTDSRTVTSGEIFVALQGENFDGHHHAEEALNRGALAAILHKPLTGEFEEKVLLVSDTLKALGDIAGALRRLLPLTVVALTGSNGKTTTKEMLASILGLMSENLLATAGNFNNLVGLPKTLFRLNQQITTVILEMGMNHFGEIARLTEIAKPDVGLITSVGAAHLEFFGSISQVAKAKGELYAGLNSGAVAVVDADEPLLVREAAKFSGNKVFFGCGNHSQVRLGDIKLEGARQRLTLYGPGAEKGQPINLKLLGQHNAHNALAAATTALVAGATWEQITQGLESIVSFPGRLNLIETQRFTVLDDSYNANPSSMAAGLKVIGEFQTSGAKGAILGDMKELGAGEIDYHLAIGKLAAEHLDFLAGVGPLAHGMVLEARRCGLAKENAEFFETPEEASAWVSETKVDGSVILVKGSHSLELNRAVKYFMQM